ncbi:hypothetical protein DPEC_G00360780 [Dallia pectoralis]|uniref:Uncharacterized protein n=1 Tax=Dallia pectoralis TaxID=75939 RepID=A0ACC2F0Y3_DALPE|nr:hypothetical protein DPEC_G00360780 [Dallia pectoralis]
MGEWSFLGRLLDDLQTHSPMLGRFWLLLMLVFRILILGTVASDLFEDEQEEFACNTLQPGCKQVCYDHAFPISQYRFWVFHIVLISTPSLIFVMYAMHHRHKATDESKTSFRRQCRSASAEERHLRRLYLVNVAFRMVTEVGFLVGQWWLYGFTVEAQFPCSRFPCPYTVDCFVSRPMEKTIFLCFYFAVGVLSAVSSLAEVVYASLKWSRRTKANPSERFCACQHPMKEESLDFEKEEIKSRARSMSEGGGFNIRGKKGSERSSREGSSSGLKSSRNQGSSQTKKTLMV